MELLTGECTSAELRLAAMAVVTACGNVLGRHGRAALVPLRAELARGLEALPPGAARDGIELALALLDDHEAIALRVEAGGCEPGPAGR